MHVCCSQRQRSPVRVTRVGTLLNILTIGREALERRVGNILTGEEEVVDDLLCKEWVVGDHWSLFTHICLAADGHREGKGECCETNEINRRRLLVVGEKKMKDGDLRETSEFTLIARVQRDER